MGEIRAIGARPEGTPWRVGIADPDRPGVLTETIDLVDRAVATSAGAGFRSTPTGRFTHLFDPATGRSPHRYRTVSVMAPTATEADALSTAFSLMPLSISRISWPPEPDVQARHHRLPWNFDRVWCLRDAGPRQSESRIDRSTPINQKIPVPERGVKQENRMRGFVFVALLAVAGAGEARAQDAAAGEKVFGVCKTCHQIGETAKNGVGPVLNGIIGRKAGSVDGYSYSAANKDSGITWDEADLPRIHQGPEGQDPRHQDDLCRTEGRAEDQRSASPSSSSSTPTERRSKSRRPLHPMARFSQNHRGHHDPDNDARAAATRLRRARLAVLWLPAVLPPGKHLRRPRCPGLASGILRRAVAAFGFRAAGLKCIGDKPPQDHPHIYLKMGDASEIVCPYCSTLFRFDPSLGAHEADPADCAYGDKD